MILYEKNDRLGGQLNLAARAPFKGHLNELISLYERDLRKLGVGIRLNKTFAPYGDDTDQAAFIVAVGARPVVVDIPGLTEKNTVTAWDLFSREVEVGQKVVVLGGGLVGCDAAEYLSEKGKHVTVLEQLKDLNVHPLVKSRKQLQKRLSKANLIFQSKLLSVVNNKMYVETDGLLQVLPAPDTFVVALGAEACSLDAHGNPITGKRIGDCVNPRQIIHAVTEGFQEGADV